jgi:membrane protein
MQGENTSPWHLGGLSLKQLGLRLWKELQKDGIFDVSATLGFYFFLALFPMLIFLVSVLSVIATPALLDKILSLAAGSMPADAYKILVGQMVNVMEQSKGGILTFSILATVWSASSGVSSVMDGLNRAYSVDDKRSFLKRRGLSLGLTVALAVLTVLGSAILVGSDKISEVLQRWSGMPAVGTIGSIVGALLGLGFMFAGLELVYFYGPNVRGQKWVWISPGSVLGVVIFVAVSFGFSQYLRFANTYNATYGSIGGIIIMMLWLYYLGIAILSGAEINAIIAEAALEHGNMSAPKFGEEEDKSHPAAQATAKPDEPDHSSNSADTRQASDKHHANKIRPPKKDRVDAFTSSARAVYVMDYERISRQTKKRMASRRIERMVRAQEDGRTQTAGWAILKRPLSAVVYLGSIGYFLFTAISRHLRRHELDAGAGVQPEFLEAQKTDLRSTLGSHRSVMPETRPIPAETHDEVYADR